jgi:uncharacterized membrane protein YfcA
MAWYFIPAVIAAGFVAGFINTLAGSGSLVTLPLLIFMGLPATVANGTNRVAIVLQNMVGVTSFHREFALDVRGAVILSAPAIVGSVLGAQIATDMDEILMRRVIGALMVVMLVVILVRPRRWLHGTLQDYRDRPKVWQLGLLFLVGMYGGFIQAGVGIFLLATLVLGIGYNLVRANAVKVAMVLLFTLSALVVFILNGQVLWGVGLVLGIGNMLGALVAAQLAVERGAPLVRKVLLIVVSISALELLGVVDLIFDLLLF